MTKWIYNDVFEIVIFCVVLAEILVMGFILWSIWK